MKTLCPSQRYLRLEGRLHPQVHRGQHRGVCDSRDPVPERDPPLVTEVPWTRGMTPPSKDPVPVPEVIETRG